MHPTILDNLGLIPAIRWLIARYDLDITLAAENADYRFDPQIEVTVFRILQSALDNVVRHTRVREANISLAYGDQMLELVVEDRGGGFDLETALRSSQSAGLIGIYQRASAVGAQVEILSQIGKGTRIEVKLPLLQGEVVSQPKPISEDVLMRSLGRYQPAPATPAASEQEIKVVIAIEQPLQRQGLRRLLESNPNLNVAAEVRDLRQTSAAVENYQPDVLIINPVGDGKKQHEVLRSIAARSPNVRMLVIATRIDPEYVLDALECGVLGYISSSVTMTDLHTAIVNVARGQIYLSPTIRRQDILAKLKPKA
jgi:AmiR/NasT family two-component response regulator